MDALQTPRVHLNGTPKQTLMDEYLQALDAARQAYNVVGVRGCPNQRDYYPLGAAAWDSAIHEHNVRMAKLKDVCDELEALVIAICDAPSPTVASRGLYTL